MSLSLPPPSAPLSARVGAALALAVPAALVAVLPAALRLASDASWSLVRAWPLLGGIAIVPIALLGLVGRRAYLGWRALGPDDAGLRLAVACGGIGWLGLLADRLGAVLRAKTHHHALAGVTFALAIVVFGAVLVLVSRRILALLRDLEPRYETLARLIAVAWAAAPVIGLVLALRAAAPDLAPEARAAVIDGAALVLGTILASRTIATPRPALAVAGPLACALLLLVAGIGLREPNLRASLDGAAPLLARLIPQ